MKKLMNAILVVVMLCVVWLVSSCAGPEKKPEPTPLPSLLPKISTIAPDVVNEGETFVSTIKITTQESFALVKARMRLPEGIQYVKSEPSAKKEGGLLTWTFPWMDRGETKSIKVWLKALKQGTYVPCASVQAFPRACFAVKVTKPKISITKTGPEVAALGQYVTFNIVVKNEGTGVAKDVVVVDTVPKGLAHDSGKKQLTFTIGDMEPKTTKTMSVKLKAIERGKHLNLASVKTSNAGKSKDDAPIVVKLEDFEITKKGMEKQYLGKKANYAINVKNVGDTTLNLQIVDNAPSGTTIVKAEDAIATTSSQARWNIPSLAPGASESFKVTLTSRVPGVHKNCATVSSKTASKTACQDTLWEGFAGLLFEVIDTEDPLQIDEKTTYIIRVTNQGTKEDNNVVVKAVFPKQIKPISASGDTKGKVEGQKVNFEVCKVLGAKKSITLKVEAQGAVVGDGRSKFYLTSDLIKKAVVEEESTHVY